MKNTNIIKRSVAGVLITAVAVCAFGCSKTSVSSKDLGNAFSAAAEENGLEELDWGNVSSDNTFHTGFSSTTTHGRDAHGWRLQKVRAKNHYEPARYAAVPLPS